MSKNVPKLRFNGYTVDWKKIKLGDAIKIVRGGSPRPIKDFMTQGEGYNWIKISDADVKSKFIYNTAEKMKAEGLSRTRLIKPGALLLSNSMSFGRPYISKIEGCIHDGWLLLEPDEGILEKNYLVQILSSETISKQYKQLAAGSTVNNLNIDLVSGVEIHIPNNVEQTKIGDFLSTIDSRITNQSSKLDSLQELKKGVMQKIFSQEIRFKREDGGEYPDWESLYLSELVTRRFKGELPKQKEDGNILLNNEYLENDSTPLRVSNNINVTPEDVLILWDGSQAGKVYTGFTGVLGSTLVGITLNRSRADNRFIYFYLGYNLETIQRSWRTGSGVPHVTKEFIEQFEVPVPSVEEQQKIANFLSTLDSKISLESQILETLQTLKKGLLQQMFV